MLASLKTPFAPKSPALDDTISFLSQPDAWDKNGVDAPFSDKRLARLQFAVALAAVDEAGRLADRQALIRAADSLSRDQAADGSWPIDDAAPVGSPTTYGPPLATALALRTLRHSDPKRFQPAIVKAEAFFRKRPVRNTPEAAALLLSLSKSTRDDWTQVDQAIQLLRKAQNEDGGWGPFPRSASEAFDTALAVIALASVEQSAETRALRRRGREALVAMQKEDGSWPETTRPAGGESYAQRMSTTAWATMALLATDPARLKVDAVPKS